MLTHPSRRDVGKACRPKDNNRFVAKVATTAAPPATTHASITNRAAMSHWEAPKARRSPISITRSLTFATIKLISVVPPKTRQSKAMLPTVRLMVFCKFLIPWIRDSGVTHEMPSRL